MATPQQAAQGHSLTCILPADSRQRVREVVLGGIRWVLMYQGAGCDNMGTASPAPYLQIHGSGYERLSLGGISGVDTSEHWCALTRASHCRRHLHLPCSTMAAGTMGSLWAAGHRHVWAMGLFSPTLRCSTVAVGRGGFALSRRNFEEVCVNSTMP